MYCTRTHIHKHTLINGANGPKGATNILRWVNWRRDGELGVRGEETLALSDKNEAVVRREKAQTPQFCANEPIIIKIYLYIFLMGESLDKNGEILLAFMGGHR